MTRLRPSKFAMASLSVMTLLLGAASASAQYGPPPGYGGGYGPPPGGPVYDPRAQVYDQGYASGYESWASQYCVQRERSNVAAGAVIGGALGAILGGGVARGGLGGTILGGALGATAGAAVGASAGTGGDCPPGYIIRAGAPRFYYAGPPVYAPPGYNPWVFVGGRYTYVPYRERYWREHGWRGHDWREDRGDGWRH
jgi:hypothetical protein